MSLQVLNTVVSWILKKHLCYTCAGKLQIHMTKLVPVHPYHLVQMLAWLSTLVADLTLQRFFTIMLMYAFMIFIISPTWGENRATQHKHFENLSALTHAGHFAERDSGSPKSWHNKFCMLILNVNMTVRRERLDKFVLCCSNILNNFSSKKSNFLSTKFFFEFLKIPIHLPERNEKNQAN